MDPKKCLEELVDAFQAADWPTAVDRAEALKNHLWAREDAIDGFDPWTAYPEVPEVERLETSGDPVSFHQWKVVADLRRAAMFMEAMRSEPVVTKADTRDWDAIDAELKRVQESDAPAFLKEVAIESLEVQRGKIEGE